MNDATLMEKIVSLAKRRGFVFPGSEIYGGLAGTYDYGPMGVLLKENIERLWLEMFRDTRDDMYGVDAAILMNSKVWEASGHTQGFRDPLVTCRKCGTAYRVDQLEGFTFSGSGASGSWVNSGAKCQVCGSKEFSDPEGFNMMFSTKAGVGEKSAQTVFLRPETAGGIFVNYKNVVDTLHPKLPFGIAQIGKAFRNEIAPRDFIFRLRELSQMEVEYFVKPSEWESAFEEWRKMMHAYAEALGLPKGKLHEIKVPDADRAHYSSRTIDFEFDYPFGRKELWGLAYRGNFDLNAHETGSKVSLQYLDEETGDKFLPHVIEPSLGVDRTLLAVLSSAYREDDLGGEVRTYLALAPRIAPVKMMVSPLLKNKPELVEKARAVRKELQKVHPSIAWDDNGNIGKRYRRQDEIGTPFCVTIDFDTLGETPELKDTVTLRDRDTGAQERLTVSEVAARLSGALQTIPR